MRGRAALRIKPGSKTGSRKKTKLWRRLGRSRNRARGANEASKRMEAVRRCYALDATLLSAGIVSGSAAETDSTASATHGEQEHE
ncbi:hypothetical protein LTR12_007456 [Friedmanniomyces endolithicus]|nr:hypothetical protein LTR12_007456 [Friedmanniomyces endolithicus]